MNLKKIEGIMEKGYDLNIVALLYMTKQGESITSVVPKLQAIVRMMENKGLIVEGRITATGEELLKFVEGQGEIVKEKEKIDAYEQIYDRVQGKILELTGAKQKRTEIFNKTYNYLPNKYDFVTRLKKVCNKYGLSDMEKLERVIIKNIEKCNKTKKWYPLLAYYFVKDDISSLASDYEGWEEEKKEIEQNYDGTNI